MYKVYLLKSKQDKSKSYVGLTIKQLSDRLKEHNEGKSRYTKAFIPWELVYYENFYCNLCAEKREQFLKSGVGYRIRRLLLQHFKENAIT